MAKATTVTGITKVVLEISQEEAEAVKSLLGRCTAGGATTFVHDALSKAGIKGTYEVTMNGINNIDLFKKESY